MLSRGILLAGVIALVGHAGCSGCGGDDDFHLDAPAPDAATFGNVSLAWTVVDLAGQRLACDAVGAKTVSLQLRNTGGAGGLPESFSCGNSPSTTRQFPSGVYNVSIELRGDDGTLVKATDQTGVVIAAGQTTQLAPVAFRVDPHGSFALSIATPPGSSNCKSPPAGAGITAMTITLKDAGGSCAAVKLLRARGTTMLPPYTVNCGSPQNAACIETDETLTPELPLPSGTYTIQIRGKIGAATCYSNDDSFVVPAQGKVLTRTLNLANGC